MSGCGVTIENGGMARLKGEMTFASTAALYRSFQKTLADGKEITVLDLDEVTRADSSALALLLEWQAMAGRRDHRLHIINAPIDLLRLAQLSEAGDLLDMQGRGDDQ